MKRRYSRSTIFALRLFLGLFVAMNVPTSRLWAAEAPKALERGDKPKEQHKFWDKTNITLQLLNVGAQAADMYSTERALNVGAVGMPAPHQESSPFRLSFVAGRKHKLALDLRQAKRCPRLAVLFDAAQPDRCLSERRVTDKRPERFGRQLWHVDDDQIFEGR